MSLDGIAYEVTDVRRAEVVGAWRDRPGTIRLPAYQLVDTGCWERAAPLARGASSG